MSLRWARGLYTLALRSYPPAFRARFGQSMVEAFVDSCEAADKRAGRFALIVYVARAITEVIGHGVRERVFRLSPAGRRRVALRQRPRVSREPVRKVIRDIGYRAAGGHASPGG